MKRLNFERAVKLILDADEETPEPLPLLSSPESEPDSDNEEDDPSYAPGEEGVEEERWTTSRGAARRWGSTARPRSPQSPVAEGDITSEPWKTAGDPDIDPVVSRFKPHRTPGVQLDTSAQYSPRDLFTLFFSMDTVLKLCSNTNKNAAKNIALGNKYKWTDVEPEDLYSFFGLLIYFSLVSLPSLEDYWKQHHILSVPFPKKVMPIERFRTIFWNIHLSDPVADTENDRRKGSPGHDKLFRIRPLYDDILTACQTYFHPRREMAVSERMVASEAKTGTTQYMKDKPTKWGMRLFVLADSCSGYTVRFIIYTGKGKKGAEQEQSISYDVVMSLVQASNIGTGYHLYVENFYTSPKLFSDLFSMKYWACGTYGENRKGWPRERRNALTKGSERGAIRWIREGPLLFVKWMDTREVSMCSTIHSAYSGDTVQRRVKEDGHWATRDIPCPASVMAYNKNMGGVDLSDQHHQYYTIHHKTGRWYKTVLLHFIDIAARNSYILHRELCKCKGGHQQMTHKDYMVELVSQLCKVEKSGVPIERATSHVPVPVIKGSTSTGKGRLRCQYCLDVYQTRHDTPWKCKACDVPLCLVVTSNCFEQWHCG